MSFKKISTVILLFVLNSTAAVAIDVNQTSILVSDTISNDSLKLKQAFAQILAINTGENIVDILSSDVFNETNIQKGVKRSYFEKIDSKYFHKKRSSFWFHLVMNEKFVQSVIQEAGFSLLPHRREKILLWAVKEAPVIKPFDSIEPNDASNHSANFETSISYAYSDELTRYWMNHWAKALGLVLVMPTMDENDMLQVTHESIISLSYQANDQSVNRYKTKHSLLVYIKHSIDAIKIRTGLTLNPNDMSIKHYQKQTDEQENAEEGEMLYSVMLDVAEQYAALNKINRDDLEKHTVRMVVHTIDDYQQVNDLRKYLDSLSMIDGYDIVSASNGDIVFDMNMTINSEAFLRIILRENILVYDNNSPINQMFFSIAQTPTYKIP